MLIIHFLSKIRNNYELLREKIIQICKNESIKDAVIVSGIGAFDITNVQAAKNYDFPVEYDVFNLTTPTELASIDGAIINYEPHIHATFGDGKRSYSGHLLNGCRVLFLCEIVIQELLGDELKRVPEISGLSNIEKKVSK